MVVAAAAVAFAMTLPAQTAGVSVFIERFVTDLGLSRTTVSLAYTGATLLAALAMPVAGRAYDRYGPRRGAAVVAVLFAASCAWMGRVEGLAGLFVGFVLLRGLGQGALALAALHAVNLWFVRRRGLAVGLMGIGMAVAIAFGPPALESAVVAYGWRDVFGGLAVLLLVVLVPVVVVLFRETPERYGLVPDGHAGAGLEPFAEDTLTLAAARRTPVFWLLVASGVTTGAIGTGLLFHHFAIVAASGVADRSVAALLFVPYGLVTAGANLGAGVLVDRLGPRRVMVLHLLLFGAMVAAVPLVASAAAVWAYGAVFGLAQGLQNTLLGSAFAYYFGRAHIGAIKGFTTTLFVAGTALGPPLVALGEAAGYATVLWALAALPLVLGLLATSRRFDRAAA